MANYIQQAPDQLGGTPTTWLSKKLWDGFKNESIASDGNRGYYKVQDFRDGEVVTDGIEGWVTTLVEAGGGETTVAGSDGHGGLLLVTCDAAEYDGAQFQQGISEWLDLDSTADLRMEIRLQLGDADQTDLFFGVAPTDTTILATSTAHANTATDYIGLQSLDATAVVSGVTREASGTASSTTLTSVSAATMTDATYVKLGFRFYRAAGNDVVDFYVNGELAGSYAGSEIPTTEVRPSLAIRTGEAVANTATIDWIAIGQMDS